MKKKYLKIIALTVAVILIIGVLHFANALNGNPISKMLAQRTADAYLAEQYPDTDYYIENLAYSFKFGCYYAHIRSESSIDTQFTLYIDMVGNLNHDTYEDVPSGSITARRLEQEYRDLTDQVFESPTFPYSCYISYGTLEIYSQEHIDDPNVTDIPDYSIVQDDLIIDHIYDPRELGAQAGHLVVYVETDIVTVEKAAEIILDIRKKFDEANIPFRAMDFVLQFPRPEEGPRPDEDVRVENFPYEDIYEDGMVDRVAAANAERQAYYARQDAKGK